MKNQTRNSKSHKNLAYLFFAALFFMTNFPINSVAQLSQVWAARYNGLGIQDDHATSMAIDAAGNVYVTGDSWGSAGTNTDYATVKYNSGGIIQWVKRYEGLVNSSYDYATSIALDASGNVYVTGSSGTGALSDYATIKYNSMGVVQWIHRFNGQDNGRDEASSMAVDASGYVYVTGRSERSGAGTNADYATVKYSPTGIQQWVRIYNGPGDVDDDKANSIAVDQYGNVYVTGRSGGNGTDYDYATVKYNAFGTQQWVARYNGAYYDEAKAVKVDASGNVFVAGQSYTGSYYELYSDYLTIKYNSSGVQQVSHRYNGPGNLMDKISSMTMDASGNVYVTGSSYSSGTYLDYATIKYNSFLFPQWITRQDGPPAHFYDVANSIAVDALGNVYVTGTSWWTNESYYLTVKYNSLGLMTSYYRYNHIVDSYNSASTIAVDGYGNVYVTGTSAGNGTGLDYATIKYSQPVGINLTNSEIPKDYSLSQNYPNPFNPTTNIKFSIPVSSNVKITVFDIQGKEVEVLVNDVMNAGVYVVDWNASALSSGTYFYTIKTESFTETKKMMLVK